MIVQGNQPYTEASFSLKNRIGRQVWNTVWLLLFRPSPRPMHDWRNLLLRLFGARLGRQTHIYPTVKIWAPWNLRIGDHVGVADGVTIYNMALIDIGDYAVVSQGAHLCGGTHDYNSANFQLCARPIHIGVHVWICAEAFLAPGVSVADGAVVGARSVVTRALDEPWTVYAGNPCKRVGARRRQGQPGQPGQPGRQVQVEVQPGAGAP